MLHHQHNSITGQGLAAIFDMDGILIDSEPLWYEAANETFLKYGFQLSHEEYAGSIGLRTKEFVAFWLDAKAIDPGESFQTESGINRLVIKKIAEKGTPMPGVVTVLELLREKGFRIGLATSSPTELINIVVDRLQIRRYFSAFSSAEDLPFGKPHPQVYLDCAAKLGTTPSKCICFEDSFNGLIAAKAARMKCIAVPAPEFRNQPRFQAADLILNSLEGFHIDMMEKLRD